jgi:hypothetical protein
MTLVWLALAVSAAAVVAAVIMAFLRGRELYRESKRVGAALSTEVARIERSAAEIEGHLEAATRSGEALSASLDRLAASRARLNVLLAALDDVRASLQLVLVFVPRK